MESHKNDYGMDFDVLFVVFNSLVFVLVPFSCVSLELIQHGGTSCCCYCC